MARTEVYRLPEGELWRIARPAVECLAGCVGVHSYTADGDRWCFHPNRLGTWAIDVELDSQQPPAALSRRYRGDNFWADWTAAEVIAKLTQTPILLLAQSGLGQAVPESVSLRNGKLDHAHYCVGMSKSDRPSVGVVLLSMGNRPTELAAALAALEKQQGLDLDVVLVGNGWQPTGLPDWVRTLYEPTNVGVPGGRNIGAREVVGDLIFFYDDDGLLPTPDTIASLVDKMTDGVAIVQPRGVDPTGKPSPRRWVPRLRATNQTGGDAVVFWEAMALIRRSAFEQVGGWPGEFFFGHEGIDLAMRLLDAGWRIRYEPSVVVNHPAHPPSRHEVFYRTNGRNRAWVARRNLPFPIMQLYILVWTLATVVRVRDRAALKIWFGGLRQGLTGPLPGERKPISWRTVWKMTKLGRPPLW